MSSISEILADINNVDVAITITHKWLEEFPPHRNEHKLLMEHAIVLFETRQQLIHDLKLIVK